MSKTKFMWLQAAKPNAVAQAFCCSGFECWVAEKMLVNVSEIRARLPCLTP